MAAGLGLALCTAMVSAESGEATHPIKLTRAMAPGQSFDYGGEGMVEQTVNGTIMGQSAPTNTTRIVVRLKSEMTVDTVDEHGRPTNTTHVVKSGAITENGEVIYEFDAGSKITTAVNGHMTDIDVDGMPAPHHLLDALRLVTSLDGEGPTEDAMYGSTTPRTVGETWPADIAALQAYFQSQMDHPIELEQISGSSTLESVFEFKGQPCAKVSTKLSTDGTIPGLGDLPPGATLEQASMVTSFESLYPQNTELAWVARSGKMDMHLVMDQPGMGRLASKTGIVVNMSMSPATADAMATVPDGVVEP
jgi:hypothetical protein